MTPNSGLRACPPDLQLCPQSHLSCFKECSTCVLTAAQFYQSVPTRTILEAFDFLSFFFFFNCSALSVQASRGFPYNILKNQMGFLCILVGIQPIKQEAHPQTCLDDSFSILFLLIWLREHTLMFPRYLLELLVRSVSCTLNLFREFLCD